jgi:hypothetical protein
MAANTAAVNFMSFLLEDGYASYIVAQFQIDTSSGLQQSATLRHSLAASDAWRKT